MPNLGKKEKIALHITQEELR